MKIKKHHNPEHGYESKEQLLLETEQHRMDVAKLMMFLGLELIETGAEHDWTKIDYFNQFAEDTMQRETTPEFKKRPWYQIHVKKERHHLNAELPKDVDLIDVLEFICDCVCAGKARTGRVEKKFLELSGDTLKKAYWNTVNKMIDEVEIIEK